MISESDIGAMVATCFGEVRGFRGSQIFLWEFSGVGWRAPVNLYVM
jgi:hypothetical protein